MKSIFVLFLLSIPLLATAQLKIGLSGTLTRTYRVLHTEPSSGVQWIIDSRDLWEIPNTAFNSGFVLNYQFRSGILLESGIQYQRYGYKYKPEDGALDSEGNIIGIISMKETYDYFSIPLRVGYGFRLGERFKLGCILGTNLNTFFNRTFSYEIKYNDGTEDTGSSTYYEDTGYSRFMIMANAGIQVDYAINQSFTVRLEPVGHYAITPVADAPIKERPYSIGLSAGIFYTLGSRKTVE